MLASSFPHPLPTDREGIRSLPLTLRTGRVIRRPFPLSIRWAECSAARFLSPRRHAAKPNDPSPYSLDLPCGSPLLSPHPSDGPSGLPTFPSPSRWAEWSADPSPHPADGPRNRLVLSLIPRKNCEVSWSFPSPLGSAAKFTRLFPHPSDSPRRRRRASQRKKIPKVSNTPAATNSHTYTGVRLSCTHVTPGGSGKP
jgi:hypothetical protein